MIQDRRSFAMDLMACSEDGWIQIIGVARPDLRMGWQLDSSLTSASELWIPPTKRQGQSNYEIIRSGTHLSGDRKFLGVSS